MSPNSLSKTKLPFLLEDGNLPKRKRNVLLLTAHPDDESMFFIPTILYLTSVCQHNIYILCISTGNAEGKGCIRKDEMLEACLVLKVSIGNVSILDLPQLQDGFDKPWSHNLLADIIGQEITNHDIDTIITFDDYGISGHPQHRAVHFGVCTFVMENMKLSQGPTKKTIDAWQLISTNIMRKYSGPLDIWYSMLYSLWLGKEESYCIFNKHPHICFLAMRQHKSQWI
ncbi:hypothetical protein KI387_022821, partial [Taxus chinensis]